MWEALQGWQQAIGAVVGFIALATAALFNAHLNRKRDDRLQGLDSRLPARSLHAEVRTIVTQLRALKRFCEEMKVKNPLDAARKIQGMLVPIETVYPQVGAKLEIFRRDRILDLAVPIIEKTFDNQFARSVEFLWQVMRPH